MLQSVPVKGTLVTPQNRVLGKKVLDVDDDVDGVIDVSSLDLRIPSLNQGKKVLDVDDDVDGVIDVSSLDLRLRLLYLIKKRRLVMI
nr:hypothetical protein [Tanacetum cinerariifolium]